jgi:hypothetical protein
MPNQGRKSCCAGLVRARYSAPHGTGVVSTAAIYTLPSRTPAPRRPSGCAAPSLHGGACMRCPTGTGTHTRELASHTLTKPRTHAATHKPSQPRRIIRAMPAAAPATDSGGQASSTFFGGWLGLSLLLRAWRAHRPCGRLPTRNAPGSASRWHARACTGGLLVCWPEAQRKRKQFLPTANFNSDTLGMRGRHMGRAGL